MCTNDTRDRVSIDGSDRHLDRPAIDMSADTWPILGRSTLYFTTLYCIYAFNGVEEGKARMEERGRDEEVASSKKKPIED